MGAWKVVSGSRPELDPEAHEYLSTISQGTHRSSKFSLCSWMSCFNCSLCPRSSHVDSSIFSHLRQTGLLIGQITDPSLQPIQFSGNFFKALTKLSTGSVSNRETGPDQGSEPGVLAIGTDTSTTDALNLSKNLCLLALLPLPF